MTIKINPASSAKLAVNPSSSAKVSVLPYIGLTGTLAARAVWDANFVAVYHMNDNPDTSHIADSTQYGNNGTKKAANEPLEVDGLLGKAQQFDGSDDYIDIGNTASLNSIASEVTLEALTKADNVSGAKRVIQKAQYYAADDNGGFLLAYSNDSIEMRIYNDSNHTLSSVGLSALTDHYLTGTFDGNYLKVFIDGTQVNSSSWTGTIGSSSASSCYIGLSYNLFAGLYSEARISNIARSDEWIAATNLNLTDALITYSISGSTITITIAAADVDADLTDFPIYLNLSASAGKTSVDLTALFTALGSYWQKLRLVDAFGRNCQMEVVSWDSGTPYAEVHAKIPKISSSAPTVLTLTF